MRVAIVGSRDYPNEQQVRSFVRALAAKHPDAVVVSGHAPGVDSWAEDEAKRLGLAFKGWPIPKGVYPRKVAPLMRNQQIVDDSDVVFAFWAGGSPGTRDAIRRAEKAGKDVYVHRPVTAGGLEALP